MASKAQLAADAIAGLDDPTDPTAVARVTHEFPAKDVAAAAATVGGSPGGSQPVSCALTATTDVKGMGAHPILWSALVSNAYDFSPLVAIPDGLGLDFDFDGSSNAITPTENGVWAFSYNLQFGSDATWLGQLATLDGLIQARPLGSATSATNLCVSAVESLSATDEFDPRLDTIADATAGSLDVQVILQIVRLG